MKKFKRFIRFTRLLLFIILAAVGVGLSGGAVIIPSNKKEDIFPVKIELVENRENEDEAEEFIEIQKS